MIREKIVQEIYCDCCSSLIKDSCYNKGNIHICNTCVTTILDKIPYSKLLVLGESDLVNNKISNIAEISESPISNPINTSNNTSLSNTKLTGTLKDI